MSRHRKGSKRQARRASIERKRGAFGTGKTPSPGNKKPARGGLLRTVIKAARIALMTPNTPRDGALNDEICR